ncbi:hypothetical protein B0H63DRAFT_474269 [Podospora didyma]|uniref:Uncharacterized protein n=1 Tax=Podospora didyma TaxID=330526 RepID=A0AAE0U0A1_9PEZI|nr:hypothetical protein B0H63DRAFT_474269 [Podospora didyma]
MRCGMKPKQEEKGRGKGSRGHPQERICDSESIPSSRFNFPKFEHRPAASLYLPTSYCKPTKIRMVIFGGLELLALKWIGGKMTAALATHLVHAGPTAVAHFAHTAATNVITTAANAGTAAGATNALYHGARAGYKMSKKVDRIQRREAREKRVAPMFADPSMTDEQRAELLGIVVLMQLMEGYYASLERTSADSASAFRGLGRKKAVLEDLEPCVRCDCKDWHRKGMSSECECGHLGYAHPKITEEKLEDPESMEWLMRGMAAEVYPLLENRDGDGDLKTGLAQVDTCLEYGCPCWDFDRDYGREMFSRRCTCGHRFREHQVRGEWRWVVGLLVAKAVEEMIGEEVSSSSSSSGDEEGEDEDNDDDDDGQVFLEEVDSDYDGARYYDSDDFLDI